MEIIFFQDSRFQISSKFLTGLTRFGNVYPSLFQA